MIDATVGDTVRAGADDDLLFGRGDLLMAAIVPSSTATVGGGTDNDTLPVSLTRRTRSRCRM